MVAIYEGFRMKFALVSMRLSDKDGVHLRRAARCIDALQDVISLEIETSEFLAGVFEAPWPVGSSVLSSHGDHVIVTAKYG